VMTSSIVRPAAAINSLPTWMDRYAPGKGAARTELLAAGIALGKAERRLRLPSNLLMAPYPELGDKGAKTANSSKKIGTEPCTVQDGALAGERNVNFESNTNGLPRQTIRNRIILRSRLPYRRQAMRGQPDRRTVVAGLGAFATGLAQV